MFGDDHARPTITPHDLRKMQAEARIMSRLAREIASGLPHTDQYRQLTRLADALEETARRCADVVVSLERGR